MTTEQGLPSDAAAPPGITGTADSSGAEALDLSGLQRAVDNACALIDRLRESERYAWKNAKEIDAERMKFRAALLKISAWQCSRIEDATGIAQEALKENGHG